MSFPARQPVAADLFDIARSEQGLHFSRISGMEQAAVAACVAQSDFSIQLRSNPEQAASKIAEALGGVRARDPAFFDQGLFMLARDLAAEIHRHPAALPGRLFTLGLQRIDQAAMERLELGEGITRLVILSAATPVSLRGNVEAGFGKWHADGWAVVAQAGALLFTARVGGDAENRAIDPEENRRVLRAQRLVGPGVTPVAVGPALVSAVSATGVARGLQNRTARAAPLRQTPVTAPVEILRQDRREGPMTITGYADNPVASAVPAIVAAVVVAPPPDRGQNPPPVVVPVQQFDPVIAKISLPRSAIMPVSPVVFVAATPVLRVAAQQQPKNFQPVMPPPRHNLAGPVAAPTVIQPVVPRTEAVAVPKIPAATERLGTDKPVSLPVALPVAAERNNPPVLSIAAATPVARDPGGIPQHREPLRHQPEVKKLERTTAAEAQPERDRGRDVPVAPPLVKAVPNIPLTISITPTETKAPPDARDTARKAFKEQAKTACETCTHSCPGCPLMAMSAKLEALTPK